jgi:hypothetical protein
MMMPQHPVKAAVRSPSLLSSCATGLALAALGQSLPAAAQVHAVQGSGDVVAGAASIDSSGGTLIAPRTNVVVETSVAVINWTPGDQSPGGTPIDFLPANGTLAFSSFVDPDFTVLNRIEAASARPIGLNGAVTGSFDVSGSGTTAGNIWFYSPTGIVAGAGSTFSVGGIVLTANDIPFTAGPSGGIDFGPQGQIRFASAPGSQASVVMLPGSRITTGGTDAYTLLVAPSVVQGGIIETDGSVGLVAAEQVSITVQNSLFDMSVEVGTSVVNALTHTGSTGLAVGSDLVTGAQKVVLLATPQNTAITMVLGGDLGATAASSNGADRAVILSGGYNYNDLTGSGLADAPVATAPVNVQIGTSSFNADFTAVTTGAIAVSPSRGEEIAFAESARLEAGAGVTVTADLDEAISVGGDLLLRGTGGSAATLRLGTSNAESGSGNAAAAVTVGGNLTVSASAAALDPNVTAQAGAAAIVLDAGAIGPALSVSGNILVEANGIGFDGLLDNFDAGGGGIGGDAVISMGAGTLSAANIDIVANAVGGSGIETGGNASAGTAQFLATGGTATLADITISADATGGAGNTANGAVDNAQAVARLSITGAGTRLDAGFGRVSANAIGQAGPGTAGTIQAGLADIQASAGGTLVSSQGLVGSADAMWSWMNSPPPVSAGDTRGGTVLVTASGGTIETSFGQFSASASGPYAAGAVGDTTGGIVTLTSSDTADGEGSADFGSGLFVYTDGFGGSGTSSGNGQGGTIALLANGGTISADTINLIADGQAGFGDTGESTGLGGQIDVLTSAGGAEAGITFGSLFITASGYADSLDALSFDPQSMSSSFSGNVSAQGGSVSISGLGGNFDGGSVFVGVTGSGGGAAQGGSFSLLLDGATFTMTSLDVDATGTGSPAGSGSGDAPGHGLGGSALILADSGSFTSDGVRLDATGYGGSGDSYFDQTGTQPGGSGMGGSAAITLGGASFTSESTELIADGIGGDGSFLGGSPGGSGTGGSAAFVATDAQAYAINGLIIRADGTAGNSTGAVTALDGIGTGGTASFVNQGALPATAGSRTITELRVSASGSGGMIGGSPGANAAPGLARFSELASGPNGRAAIGNAAITAAGLSAPTGAGVLLESAGGNLTVDDSFIIDSAGTVTINVTGNSSILTGGAATISSGYGDVVINHFGQTSPAHPTIVGGDLLIDAARSIDAAPGTLITASQRLTLLARDGSIATGGLTAGEALQLTAASGAIDMRDGTAGGTVSLDAGSGVTIGSARAGDALNVTAGGALTIETLATGATVIAQSSDIVIGGAANVGTPGTTALVELINSDPTRRSFYGGTDNAAGYSLSSAEASRLFADNIVLFAPRVASSSAALPDVVVGDMTITGRASNASGQLGPQGAFTIRTEGIVQIGGGVRFADMAAGNTFAIRAGDLIILDNQAGFVDLRGPNNALAGDIDFSAGTIMAVSPSVRQALSGSSDPATIDALLAVNNGAANDQGVLRAGGMRFTVTEGLYIQNTGQGIGFPQRRGFTTGAGGIAIATQGSAGAPLVVINGRIATTGPGGFATGTDTIPLVQINGQPAPSSTGSAAGSTVNGCDIFNAADCTLPLPTPSALISPTRDIVEIPVDPSTGSGTDAVSEKQKLIAMDVEMDEVGRLGYEPLIDEPVTGSGNDDLWMSDCDPNGQGDCAQPPAPRDAAP